MVCSQIHIPPTTTTVQSTPINPSNPYPNRHHEHTTPRLIYIPNNRKLTNTGITNNLRSRSLRPHKPGRDNRLHTNRINPLNRRRRLRRPRLPPLIPAPARRPILRRGIGSLSLGRAGWKLYPARDQDGGQACSGCFVRAGYLWAFCFWACVQGEEGVRNQDWKGNEMRKLGRRDNGVELLVGF